VELPVHALLPWAEVGGRLGHGDYLRPVDLVGVSIGHNGRRAFVEDVLQPIRALTIRAGDQEAVIMLDRDDRCLVRPAQSSAGLQPVFFLDGPCPAVPACQEARPRSA
jgi:hypothetical protein